MTPKKLPPESLPRRSPGGGFQPITIHVRINRDRSYLPSDSIFEFRYVVEHVPRRPTQSPTQRLEEPADLKESPNTATLEEKSSGSTATATSSSSSRQSDQDTIMASPPSGSSRIWGQVRHDWGFVYYIRVDLGGCFHTYPHTGGRFQSSEEAESAMDRYFHERRDPTLLVNQGAVPSVEMAIEQALYWPDGRRKKRSKWLVAEQTGSQVHRLVEALVDKHNEDHNLLGDLAYELKDVVHYRNFCEKRTWFYHLNFTMTKVAGDFNCGNDNNLFFAEVKCVRQGKQEELLVSCLRMVEAKKRELRRLFTGSDDPNVKTILWMHPDEVLLEED
ncbi:uncharacterized protein LOC124671153 [Lolium rigidum]|uniref:uncharacterized protein LOC124671153 n=1 Tax=Lolium rigidum TaxID=89674 RepID=UPI001F5CE30B|nr:uncharacterized protein LOC124671153 [Lolium rigidum]